MTIGELDRRVVIENVSTSRNSYGELERTYESFRTVWAAIEWKGGTEGVDQSEKITGMTKLHIYIRNLDMSNLSLQSRLTYDGKYYFPKVINQIEGRTAFLEIICENKD